MADDAFADYVSKKLKAQIKERESLCQAINMIVRSDAGEELFKLLDALISGFKDEHVFEENDRRRERLRGSIVGLQALLSAMVDLAEQYEDGPPASGVPDGVFEWGSSDSPDVGTGEDVA